MTSPCFARDKNLDSPAEMNSSIFSLKGWRWSSDEFSQTFFTAFSQAVREETIDKRERCSKLRNDTYWLKRCLLKSSKAEWQGEEEEAKMQKFFLKNELFWIRSVFVLSQSFINIQTWRVLISTIIGRKSNNIYNCTIVLCYFLLLSK